MNEIEELHRQLQAASGGDAKLDHCLATVLNQPPAPYTESVDACRRLQLALLPAWRLHLGYDARGFFPYAALSLGSSHVEAVAPTVPLAILRALLNVLATEPANPTPEVPPAT